MNTYEDTSTTAGSGAFTTKTLDLTIGIDLVILQDGHLDLLPLVLDLLGGSVGLLLTLLGTTTETNLSINTCPKGEYDNATHRSTR